MVDLGALTPPTLQPKSSASPRKTERGGGLSVSVVRVTALMERAMSRVERRSSVLLFTVTRSTRERQLASLELRHLSRVRSALAGLVATTENDSVILETLQMAAHDTEAMIAELESNTFVRLRCLIRQFKALLPELRARGVSCDEWVEKLREIKSLTESDDADEVASSDAFCEVGRAIWNACESREQTLLDHLLVEG